MRFVWLYGNDMPADNRLLSRGGFLVLTAALPGKSAYEDYKGHGVCTYALMEALHKGDTNNNGKIEVTELVAHVERRVPELFDELKQNGWVVKGLTAARGVGGDARTAHISARRERISRWWRACLGGFRTRRRNLCPRQ